MKWIKHAIAVAVITTGTGITLYWDEIQDIRGLMIYSSVFEKEHIHENFRSLYDIYPSISIQREGAVAEINQQPNDDIFPGTVVYNDESFSPKDLMQVFHQTGLIVLKDGNLIYENYAHGNGHETHHIEMSVTKSLTSILVGVAHDEGKLPDLNALVTDFVPELKGTGYEQVTVQQVLDMTSGIRYVEDYDDLNSDIVQTVLAMLRGSLDEFSKTIINQREPGTFNQYASIETQVLAWVLRRATGMEYADYFQQKLWAKIGAESDAKMLIDQAGEPVAFGGASLRLRDLARVGQMLVNNGVSMTGERVVSEEWIKQSITTDTPQSKPGDHEYSDYELGYKNQWWIPTDRDGNEYTAIGIYGQFLYINPERRVVIAMNSAFPEYNEKPDMELKVLASLQAIAKQVSP